MTDDEELPDHVDWEANGAVTPPRTQAFLCGSCWAVAGVGAVEGIHKITRNELPILSVQCVVDCAERYLNGRKVRGGGCGGGQLFDVLEYARKHGLNLESDYPISWFFGRGRCKGQMYPIASQISSYHGFETTEERLMKAVARQPIAIAVDSFPSEATYKGGIIKLDDWPPATELRYSSCHAILLVGYGVDAEGARFWKVKNSRGTGWGDKGYAYLQRGIPGTEGVGGMYRHWAFYPIMF